MHISSREKNKRWAEAMELAQLWSGDNPLLTVYVVWVPAKVRYFVTARAWEDDVYSGVCEAVFRAGHEVEKSC